MAEQEWCAICARYHPPPVSATAKELHDELVEIRIGIRQGAAMLVYKGHQEAVDILRWDASVAAVLDWCHSDHDGSGLMLGRDT